MDYFNRRTTGADQTKATAPEKFFPKKHRNHTPTKKKACIELKDKRSEKDLEEDKEEGECGFGADDGN